MFSKTIIFLFIPLLMSGRLIASARTEVGSFFHIGNGVLMTTDLFVFLVVAHAGISRVILIQVVCYQKSFTLNCDSLYCY